MFKIRIQAEDSETVEIVAELLEFFFQDEFRFSAPRLGQNPKYRDNPKYVAYGEPRVKNGKPKIEKADLVKIKERLIGRKELFVSLL